MLGFLELAASQGFNENQLYQMALILNSYWFPDTYLTLGYNFSSASGYQQILAHVTPPEQKGGGSCGV
jgi:hypothetical protein